MTTKPESHRIEPMPRAGRIGSAVLLTPALYLATYLVILGAFSALGFSPFGAPHPLAVVAMLVGHLVACSGLTAALTVAACLEKAGPMTYTASGAIVGTLSLAVISDLPGYAEGFWVAPLQHGMVGFWTGFAVTRVFPRLDR